MKSHPIDPVMVTPKQVDIVLANKEIYYWQRQALHANNRIASLVEKHALDKKSLLGQIKQLKNRIKELESTPNTGE